jgi:hypothetical protein
MRLVLDSSISCIMSSNPAQSMDLCVRFSICCVVPTLCLEMDRSPVKGVLTKCFKDSQFYRLILFLNRPENLIGEMCK